ncbi:MAG: type II toxin-antitoxin system ParD family antitoxin [Methylobacteriaceae bacterium]|nr:type II toxin-antitoxin system ParD family antitoxin [Methylobacteriaceae bacterium]
MAQSSVKITVSEDVAERIRAKVTTGSYSSESEVISDGLLALEAQDADLERWLRETVAPTFDRVKRGEEKLIPIEEVFDGLLERHKARTANKAR